MVICLNGENPDSFPEVEEVGMPVHIRSGEEYGAMLQRCGWSEVETEVFVPQCGPGVKPNMHERSLGIVARKPLGVQ